MDRLRMAFTLVIVTLAIVGLTVHYWNGLWIFWGLCIGIRGSIREFSLRLSDQRHAGARRVAPAL